MRATGYLIAMICFALATIAGAISLMLDKGHWSLVAIPFALLIMSFVLWGNARRHAGPPA